MWRGRVWQGVADLGLTGPDWTGQGGARLSGAWQDKTRTGMLGHPHTPNRRGLRPRRATQGEARCGRARLGMTKPGGAGLGETTQDKEI